MSATPPCETRYRDPGRIAAVLRTGCVAVLGLLDLAADRCDDHVPLQLDARVTERVQRLEVAGERPFHVRDAEPVEPAVGDEMLRLEARHVLEPRLATRVGRVHVAVEHQALAPAGTRRDPERVRAVVLDLLPLHLQPEPAVQLDHQLGHPLLVAREAVDVDHPARRLDEPFAIDA